MGNYWLEKSKREEGRKLIEDAATVYRLRDAKVFCFDAELSEKQIEQIYTYMKEKPGL